MKHNVGKTDRKIRLAVGLIIFALAFLLFGGVSTTLGMLFTVIGAILVTTGIVNFCPVYKLFGFSTR